MNWTFYTDESDHYSCTRTLQDIMNVEVVVVKHEKDYGIADDVRDAEFLHTVVFLEDYSLQDLIDILRKNDCDERADVLNDYLYDRISDEEMDEWWRSHQHNEEVAAIIAEGMTGRSMPAVVADSMAERILGMEDDDEDVPITYSLYQLDPEKGQDRVIPRMFLPYDSLSENGLQFESSLYRLVYTGKIKQYEGPDDIFFLLNCDEKPEGYQGRNISVSDVIVVHRPQGILAYYVNPIGYQPLFGLQEGENTLK